MGRVGEVVIKDLGLENYASGLRELSQFVVKAGYPSEVDVGNADDGDDWATEISEIALVALANEFGTDKVPERSFIRSAIDEGRRDIENLKAELAQRVAVGQLSAKQALEALGVKAVDLIKNKIVEIKTPANAPLTVAIKGYNNPLIRTGQMKNSTQFVVARK